MEHTSVNLSKVQIQSDGTITRLVIDGVDMSRKVSEVSFSVKAGEYPTLTVKMFVDGADIQSVVQVVQAEKDGDHTSATVYPPQGNDRRGVEVAIKGEPREIAALVAALQERQYSVVNITQQVPATDVIRQISEGLSSRLSSSRIPE